jgi:hypothetical protein
MGVFNGPNFRTPQAIWVTTTLRDGRSAGDIGARGGPRSPKTKLGLSGEMTLEQACPPEYRRAQCAFKDSMIH